MRTKPPLRPSPDPQWGLSVCPSSCPPTSGGAQPPNFLLGTAEAPQGGSPRAPHGLQVTGWPWRSPPASVVP